MLPARDQDRRSILEYAASQLGDEPITLAQKLYTERLGSIVHDVWDVHTEKARWWVITHPTNLYSQDQFPNMDLALTFHVGLCLRVPKDERAALDGLWAEPFMECARGLDDATEALSRSEEVSDFQAIGMRTREVLVSLMSTAQAVVASEVAPPHPKGSDVIAWSDAVADLLFPGSSNARRRSLAKKSAKEAWEFVNWLTHARGAGPQDAQAALDVTSLVVSVFTTALIRRARGVPDQCPRCGSRKLSPERANDPSDPESTYERPVCGRCAWRGTPIRVGSGLHRAAAPAGECTTMEAPLRGPVRRK